MFTIWKLRWLYERIYKLVQNRTNRPTLRCKVGQEKMLGSEQRGKKNPTKHQKYQWKKMTRFSLPETNTQSHWKLRKSSRSSLTKQRKEEQRTTENQRTVWRELYIFSIEGIIKKTQWKQRWYQVPVRREAHNKRKGLQLRYKETKTAKNRV